ncbi:MAG: hypothetical protein JNM96_05020, partial [Bacteroidia bacterium]|nr:hypothetical protein [Bacteroidia bacterium]
MKKIYILFTAMLIGSQISKAQLTLTYANNAPVVGDINLKIGYDSTSAIPKSTGSAQSWNFTSFTANSFTETITYTTVAASPAASLFTSANLASQRG